MAFLPLFFYIQEGWVFNVDQLSHDDLDTVK